MKREDRVLIDRLLREELGGHTDIGDAEIHEVAKKTRDRIPEDVSKRLMLEITEQAITAMRRTGGNVSNFDLEAAGMGESTAMFVLKHPEFLLKLRTFLVDREGILSGDTAVQ